MRKTSIFLSIWFGLSVFQTAAFADTETARSAVKQINASNSARAISSSTSRVKNQKNISIDTTNKTTSRATTIFDTSRPISNKTSLNKSDVEAKQRDKKRIQHINSASVVSRKAQNNSIKTNIPKTSSVTNRLATRVATNKKTIKRAAIDSNLLNNIKTRDFSKCKDVFVECMDEFCANKDSALRRCACSSRLHEFDNMKTRLAQVEDKMLNFNQRLLTVNMDKEDAAAINIATEGEQAYQTKDRSESESILQKITKSLNGGDSSKINTDLSAISLSLNAESAWDNIDSLSGATTTSKEGLDLYNAALPICNEMAAEICSKEDLEIAQNSYMISIEQDCNTVSKSYSSQYDQAMNKLRESSALLDMSRLGVYQERNSDDIITCKKKILDQLSDESVCGANLYRCLDTTGQYVDASTGEAFLSDNLYNFTNLLQSPSGEENWTDIPENSRFVNFLSSKKSYIESATKNCEKITDIIWDDFLNDALSQIKLAQEAKLEEVRQSCTKLLTECLNNTYESIENFDSRALSTFSLQALQTSNALCSSVKNSCTALLKNTSTGTSWAIGINNIEADIAYDKILETCMTVGKNCIIQQCQNASSNFGLCEDANSSGRMKLMLSIDNNPCLAKVQSCVAEAKDSLHDGSYYTNLNLNFFKTSYGKFAQSDLYSFIDDTDAVNQITSRIWGHCSEDPKKQSSKILSFQDSTLTLLSWFAENTGQDSCYTKSTTYFAEESTNKNSGSDTTESYISVGKSLQLSINTKTVTRNVYNTCSSNKKDTHGNCCKQDVATVELPDQKYAYCTPSGYNHIQIINENNDSVLLCITQEDIDNADIDEKDAFYNCANKNQGILVEIYNKNIYYASTESNSTPVNIASYKICANDEFKSEISPGESIQFCTAKTIRQCIKNICTDVEATLKTCKLKDLQTGSNELCIITKDNVQSANHFTIDYEIIGGN